MPAILKIDEIKSLLKEVDVKTAMEIGFKAYSNVKVCASSWGTSLQ